MCPVCGDEVDETVRMQLLSDGKIDVADIDRICYSLNPSGWSRALYFHTDWSSATED